MEAIWVVSVSLPKYTTTGAPTSIPFFEYVKKKNCRDPVEGQPKDANHNSVASPISYNFRNDSLLRSQDISYSTTHVNTCYNSMCDDYN